MAFDLGFDPAALRATLLEALDRLEAAGQTVDAALVALEREQATADPGIQGHAEELVTSLAGMSRETWAAGASVRTTIRAASRLPETTEKLAEALASAADAGASA